MAWHILHAFLEQVRVQSTFPGKLWILFTLLFRIVVVSRIGDMVYHDEQSSFVCNTLTPGCTNVCFNRFSPISQLRYWSLMILVVATPSVIFFFYATHVIYHASVKYPSEEETENPKLAAENEYVFPPGSKRRRESGHVPTAPPLYEVTKLDRYKTGKVDGARRRKQRTNREDGIKTTAGSKKGSNVDNLESLPEEFVLDYRVGYPVYDRNYRQLEYVKPAPNGSSEIMKQRKLKKRMLEHSDIRRVYWWHVFIRLVLEVGCLLGQYYLYGWEIHELYECPYWPCPKTVDCFVSRPQEKACLLWLMYGLGFISTVLCLWEFWSLGLTRVKNAFCIENETPEERRRRRALLAPSGHEPKHSDNSNEKLIHAVSLESLSSESTVWSV